MRKITLLFCLLILSGCFSKWDKKTTDQVLHAIQAAKLEAENVRPIEPNDYGLAPMLAKEGKRFYLPSLCDECGGRILAFTRKADLEKTKTFYDAQAKESAAFFSWVFVKDNLLLQLNGELPKEKAEAYNAALQSLK